MPYMNVTEVESSLVGLSGSFPGTCELIELPETTHEGRTTHAVRVGLGPLDDRPGITFIGGQHAREWGSCEICVNVAADLLHAYDAGAGLAYGGASFSAATVRHLVEDAQIFVFPCVNPDGRHHSQTDPAAVLWRRNRNPDDPVDLNRNYDFLWDFRTAFEAPDEVSISDDSEDQTYRGETPISEPETRNVKWLLDTYPQIRWLVDIHSFSRLLLHDWGDDENQVTDPAQNFRDPAFDGERDLADDDYGEHIPSEDLGTQCGLVQRMERSLRAVRGVRYDPMQIFELYPTAGTLSDYAFSRHLVDSSLTKTHGFAVEWGTEFQPPWSEMENIIADVSAALVGFAETALEVCGVLDVTLETANLEFDGVPEGETTFRAVTFSVTACCSTEFEIVDGPTVTSGPPGTDFDTPLGTSDTAPAAPESASWARLWISYTGTDAGDMADGTVTVRCRPTNQEWEVPITATVVEEPSAAVALVLDRSNSMNFASGLGPGISRADVLQFSAPPVMDVIEDNNALGIGEFDHDWDPLMRVRNVNPGSRSTANGHIADYSPNPDGWTSIGEAVAGARDLLDAPAVDEDVRAMVVLTDGRENHDGYTRRYIDEVGGSIDAHVYGIGLGTAENLRPAALRALCQDNEGYLMMTGDLDSDALFRVTKYYQQILAGITNRDIIVDPEGALKPGQRHVVPFRLTEADRRADVLLLSLLPDAFRFQLETPAGDRIEPATASTNPGVEIGGGDQVSFYRVTLPVPLETGERHAGRWKAILEMDEGRYHECRQGSPERLAVFRRSLHHGIRYSLMARAHSSLRMSASTSQTGQGPGAEVTLRATLSEYGAPVADRARVYAEATPPGGPRRIVPLAETEPGVFEAETEAPRPGVYTYRMLASGETLRGTPFTREQTRTAAVWQGGNREVPRREPAPSGPAASLCELLRCLLASDQGQRLAKRWGTTAEELERCLKAACREEVDPR